jgi:hypothetical protein
LQNGGVFDHYLLPDGGAFDLKFAQKIKCPTYAQPHPPLWGLTLIGALVVVASPA